jgi:hypothetical protein
MTTSEQIEILQKLIAHYERAVAQFPNINWKSFLLSKNIGFGVCSCAKNEFDTNVSDIIKSIKFYWFTRPYYADNRDEALELLQLRIDRMKDILLSLQKDKQCQTA